LNLNMMQIGRRQLKELIKRERLKKTWCDCDRGDMESLTLSLEDAQDGSVQSENQGRTGYRGLTLKMAVNGVRVHLVPAIVTAWITRDNAEYIASHNKTFIEY